LEFCIDLTGVLITESNVIDKARVDPIVRTSAEYVRLLGAGGGGVPGVRKMKTSGNFITSIPSIFIGVPPMAAKNFTSASTLRTLK